MGHIDPPKSVCCYVPKLFYLSYFFFIFLYNSDIWALNVSICCWSFINFPFDPHNVGDTCLLWWFVFFAFSLGWYFHCELYLLPPLFRLIFPFIFCSCSLGWYFYCELYFLHPPFRLIFPLWVTFFASSLQVDISMLHLLPCWPDPCCWACWPPGAAYLKR